MGGRRLAALTLPLCLGMAAPAAALEVEPASGCAPLSVEIRSDGEATPGDGGSPLAAGGGAYVFDLPGGYVVRSGDEAVVVLVGRPPAQGGEGGCEMPPAPDPTAHDPDGGVRTRWDGDDGAAHIGPTPPEGVATARLMVVDDRGLYALDRRILNPEAARVEAFADVDGDRITVSARATVEGDLQVLTRLGPGPEIDAPGPMWLVVTARLVDEDGGEIARDRLALPVAPGGPRAVPPYIVSLPGADEYPEVWAAGTPPLRWSTDRGAIDEAGGALRAPGGGAIVLRVDNDAGFDEQALWLSATEPGDHIVAESAAGGGLDSGGCACGLASGGAGGGRGGGAGSLWLIGLLALGPARRRLAALLGLLGAVAPGASTGCGDGLVEGDYAGEALWSFETEFVSDAGVFSPADIERLELSILWATDQLDGLRPDRGRRQLLTPVRGSPGRYMALDPPPDAAVRDGAAVGRLILGAPAGREEAACGADPPIVGGLAGWVIRWDAQAEEPDAAWALREVIPRAECTWIAGACAWVCAHCPDELGPPQAVSGPLRLRRASAPGRFRPARLP